MSDQAEVMGPIAAVQSYDAFITYATRGDYQVARQIESFCEGFHRSLGKGVRTPRALRLCRDGSDFRLLRKSLALQADKQAVWEIIRRELEASRYLLVLCSEEATQSIWVACEIEWMLANRGPESILLALTGRANPKTSPGQVFPAAVRTLDLDSSRVWYDFRALRGIAGDAVRNSEDELVRLVGDLLDWKSAEQGPLAELWMREQARRSRQRAWLVAGVGCIVTVLGAFAWLEAKKASEKAHLARNTAIVTTAAAATDPAVAALLLIELERESLPDQAIQVAADVAATRIPLAVLRGHVGRIGSLAVSPDETQVLTAAADGEVRLWPIRGTGDPMILARHAIGTTGARFVANGDDVLTWGSDGRVSLVNLRSRQTLTIGFSGPVKEAFVLEGSDRRLLAWLEDNTVEIAVSQGPPQALTTSAPVINLCPRADGGALVLTTTGLALNVTATDTTLPSIAHLAAAGPGAGAGRLGDLSRAVCTPDGANVAWVGSDGIVVRHQGTVATPVISVSQDAKVTTAGLNLGGDILTVGRQDGKILQFEVSSGRVSRQFDPDIQIWSNAQLRGEEASEVPEYVSVNEFASDAAGRVVAAIYSDAPTRIWGLAKAPIPRTLRNPFGQDHVALSQHGRYVVTAADDGAIRVWNGQEVLQPAQLLHSERLYAMALDTTGEWIAAGAADGSLGVWHRHERSIHAATPYAALAAQCGAPNHKGDAKVMALAFEAGSPVLRVAYRNGPTARWRVLRGGTLQLLDAQCTQAELTGGVAIGDRGALLLARTEGAIEVWREGVMAVRLAGAPSVVPTAWAARSYQGPYVAGYEDGHVLYWKNATANPIEIGRPAHHTHVFCACLSRDGQRLLTGSEDGTAKLWRIGRAEPLTQVSDVEVGKWMEACAMLDERKEAVVASETGRMWRIRLDGSGTPELFYDDRGLAHVGTISAIVWLPKHDWILTGGGLDTAVRLWDTVQRRPLARFDLAAGTVTALAFADNEHTAIALGEDQTVSTWSIDWASIVSGLQDRTTATLVPAERERLLGESPNEAWQNYVARERMRHRTPLPKDFSFRIPF